jgi:Ca2+-binding EF-hand superfamily protein
MIDAEELMNTMNNLGLPISNREAKEMIAFADHRKSIRVNIVYNSFEI